MSWVTSGGGRSRTSGRPASGSGHSCREPDSPLRTISAPPERPSAARHSSGHPTPRARDAHAPRRDDVGQPRHQRAHLPCLERLRPRGVERLPGAGARASRADEGAAFPEAGGWLVPPHAPTARRRRSMSVHAGRLLGVEGTIRVLPADARAVEPRLEPAAERRAADVHGGGGRRAATAIPAGPHAWAITPGSGGAVQSRLGDRSESRATRRGARRRDCWCSG
jgi:hypothetical protein